MTLFAVRNGLVTLSFNNNRTFDNIISDLTKKVRKLESLAEKEEQAAEDFLQAHLSAKALTEKARKTAANIGKLFA